MAELNARIIAKASATGGEVPSSADLEVAELAVNTADATLYTKHTDGSIKAISGGSGGGGSVFDLTDVKEDTVPGFGGLTTLVTPQVNNILQSDQYFVSGTSLYLYYDIPSLSAVQEGDVITLQATDASATQYVATIEEFSFSGLSVRWTFVEGVSSAFQDIVEAVNGTLILFGENIVGASSLPPAEGQTLVYSDLREAFVPTNFPASVNGETGAVSLGIQDMDDFALNSQGAVGVGGSRVKIGPLDMAASVGGFAQENNIFIIDHVNADGIDQYQNGGWVSQIAQGGQIFVTDSQGNQVSTSVNSPPTVDTSSQYGPRSYFNVSLAFESAMDALPDGEQVAIGVGGPYTPPSLEVPLVEGDILQWNNADQKFKPAQLTGNVDSLNDLSDVNVPSPSVAEVLAWDGSQWVSVASSGVEAQPPGVVFSAETSLTSPLNGGDSLFMQGTSAWTSQGWTVLGGQNQDEGTTSIPWPAEWNLVEYIDSGVSTTDSNWFLNNNGGIGWDAGGETYDGRSGNSQTGAASIDFYISWWNQDTETIRAGYKTVTEGGEDFFIVRCEQKIPYSFDSGSIAVETWFGKNGSLQVKYGALQNGSNPFNVAPNQNVILVSGAYAYPGQDKFPGITGSGSYVAKYTVSNGGIGPTDSYISLTALKAEVAASADFADFQARIAAL